MEQDVDCDKQVNVPIMKQNFDVTVNQLDNKVVPVRITEEDIEEEVSYWKPSIVGYVAGANPPMHVLEGFVRRIWKEDVDKVGMIGHGVFLIRFVNEEVRDRTMNGGFFFIYIYKKSFVMQIWNLVDNFAQMKFDIVQTLIQLKGMEIKYWGQCSLFKIVEQIWRPIQMDEHTARRNKLMYPRLMIEVKLNQNFPQVISFVYEFCDVVILDVQYEWIPRECLTCSGMGHEAKEYRKEKKFTQVWKPKQKTI